MTIETRTHLPNVEQKPLIGCEQYEVAWSLNSDDLEWYYTATSWITEQNARFLSYRMHNNSAVASSDSFGDKRPASAYFTLFGKLMILEWGEIDPAGDGKLHDYLNRRVDYLDRVQNGGVVRSGHIGWITLPSKTGTGRIALIDSLIKGVVLNSQECLIATTLIKNRIIPITSDGYPVSLPR